MCKNTHSLADPHYFLFFLINNFCTFYSCDNGDA